MLHGHRLKGAWVLVHMKPKKGERDVNWLLIKEKDDYVRADAGIDGFDTSVQTGRTMDEIARGEDEAFAANPFDHVDVELAKLVSTAPPGDDWLFEVKYDGYRIVAYVEGGRARLVTRNGNDYTRHFPAIARSLEDWAAGRAMVLDGELVVTDEAGKTDFQALQNFLRDPSGKHPAYVAFDLLAFEGDDLRDRPLAERKELLESLMSDAPDDLRYSVHVHGNGADSFRAACEQQLEGVVGKRADSPYRGVRNGDWIKLKCGNEREFVVGGYTQSAKRVRGISSLLLGAVRGRPARVRRTRGLGIERSDLARAAGRVRRPRATGRAFRRRAEAAPGRARRMAGPPNDRAGEIRRMDRGRPAATPQLPGHPHRQRPARRATGTRIGT